MLLSSAGSALVGVRAIAISIFVELPCRLFIDVTGEEVAVLLIRKRSDRVLIRRAKRRIKRAQRARQQSQPKRVE